MRKGRPLEVSPLTFLSPPLADLADQVHDARIAFLDKPFDLGSTLAVFIQRAAVGIMYVVMPPSHLAQQMDFVSVLGELQADSLGLPSLHGQDESSLLHVLRSEVMPTVVADVNASLRHHLTSVGRGRLALQPPDACRVYSVLSLQSRSTQLLPQESHRHRRTADVARADEKYGLHLPL